MRRWWIDTPASFPLLEMTVSQGPSGTGPQLPTWRATWWHTLGFSPVLAHSCPPSTFWDHFSTYTQILVSGLLLGDPNQRYLINIIMHSYSKKWNILSSQYKAQVKNLSLPLSTWLLETGNDFLERGADRWREGEHCIKEAKITESRPWEQTNWTNLR